MVTYDLQAVAKEKSYALQLLQRFTEINDKQNLVFSPLSIMTLLGIVLNVADEQTKQKILRAWNFSEDTGIAEINKLLTIQRIIFNEQTFQLENAPPIYKIANALLLNPQYYLTDDFQHILEQYQTEHFILDENATYNANNWISEATDGQINNLIDHISPEAIFILINAISFHGKWPEYYFNEQHTQLATFYGTKQTTVAMMQQDKLSNYYEDDNLQAIAIDYEEGEYSLLIMLPKSKEPQALDILIKDLSIDYLQQITEQVSSQENTTSYIGTLYLPRFSVTYENEQLVELSQQLFGFDLNYDNQNAKGAYFDTAVTNPPKFDHIIIDKLVHKATITVNEEGTDAAAVTAMSVRAGAASEITKIIYFDMQVEYPFIFGIQDRFKRLLFLGTVREIENVTD